MEKILKRSNFLKNENFAKRITPQCSPMIILYVVKLCAHKKTTPCIYLYIYKKLSPKWKNFHKQKVFFFRFYILGENFSKIGPIIKKIPYFVNDPLNFDINEIEYFMKSLWDSWLNYFFYKWIYDFQILPNLPTF